MLLCKLTSKLCENASASDIIDTAEASAKFEVLHPSFCHGTGGSNVYVETDKRHIYAVAYQR